MSTYVLFILSKKSWHMVSESHPNVTIQKYETFETIKLLLNFCQWWTLIKHEVLQWIGYEFYNTIYGHWGITCNPGILRARCLWCAWAYRVCRRPWRLGNISVTCQDDVYLNRVLWIGLDLLSITTKCIDTCVTSRCIWLPEWSMATWEMLKNLLHSTRQC